MKRRTFLSATVSAATITLAGCTGSSDPETPDEVAEALLQSVLDGDYETAQTLVTAEMGDDLTQTFVDEQEAYAERANGEISSVEIVNETDSQAQVDAIMIADTALGARTTHLRFELTKVDGEWLVASLDSI